MAGREDGKRCWNCHWWLPHGKALTGRSMSGECRAHPPTALAGGKAVWPAVQENDWCGQHKPTKRSC